MLSIVKSVAVEKEKNAFSVVVVYYYFLSFPMWDSSKNERDRVVRTVQAKKYGV